MALSLRNNPGSLELVRAGARFLCDNGCCSTPFLDAALLLTAAAGVPKEKVYGDLVELSDEIIEIYKSFLDRRVSGEPVAYIVGYKEFFGRNFKVSPSVLIPRPETECIVDAALEYIKTKAHKRLSICDVGTGSGIIAITLACEHPFVELTAVDISSEALETAIFNAKVHGVHSRIKFECSDLFLNEDVFSMVISNPPYLSEYEYNCSQIEIRKYEPKAALSAGADGSELIYRLIRESPSHLEQGGCLICETGPKQIHNALEEAVKFFNKVDVIKCPSDIDIGIIAVDPIDGE